MSGEAGMGREKRGKQTLRNKMMVVMLISAMSSILAVVIVSYMTIRMIRNDSIEESMQIYLEQITRETDSAYYDMISIVNQMSPSGLIGNVVESYLSAEDNFDKYVVSMDDYKMPTNEGIEHVSAWNLDEILNG